MEQGLLDNASESLPSISGSRATSPGAVWREAKTGKVVEVERIARSNPSAIDGTSEDGEKSEQQKPSRYRPRTLPYQSYLPYRHEDRKLENLEECLRRLYVAVSAGDFVPGVTHWTRELRAWVQLKFDLPREDRVRLAKLYYELALAPGMDSSAAERFSSMFMTLTKRKHYLRPGEDLTLNWKPLYREIKFFVLPIESSPVVTATGAHSKRNYRTLLKMCAFAQLYFDPKEVPAFLEEILPYFSLSSPETAYAVIGILNLLLPTNPPARESEWQPQHILPTIFHLWSLMNRSKTADQHFVDLLSRLARDTLPCSYLNFSRNGIFTDEQASVVFTSILRLLEIPMSQVTSPYSATVDMYVGLAAMLERDTRKHPISHVIARWIVMSLSPASVDHPNSMLGNLEALIQAVETFFHPSNTGAWTKTLSQLVFYLSDFFVMRWNRERSGEMSVPEDRRLNDAIKRRFVLCLRDVTFMGIFAKSSTAMSYSLSSLQSLAFLEPRLILPGALQRIYPSLRGLVEVHRTTSSIRALHELTRTMTKTKGFRCHVTSLLGLALPGIDANDLDKTIYTLSYMQALFYNMPLYDLTRESGDSMNDDGNSRTIEGSIAAQWVTEQIERLEQEGVDVEIDYETELSDEDEITILRSSTADFANFLSSFLERVFNLLRNLPDAAKVKSGSPEENIANSLPATFTPLFASMHPDLYDLALNKIADFVSQNVVYQARDGTAYICSAICKVNPKKALSVLIPILTRGIRTEIEENGAGSTRTTGTEVLPRDKALVWNMSILSMSLAYVGSAVMDFEEQLTDIALFMQQKCKGIPSTHASTFLHHILLTLTMTYTVDYSLYDDTDGSSGITPAHWGLHADPQRLKIKWHYAERREIDFAVRLFKLVTEREIDQLKQLTSGSTSVKRDGSNKDWSDEVVRSLVALRLSLAGMSSLFDPKGCSQNRQGEDVSMDGHMSEIDDTSDIADIPEDDDFGATDDEDVRPRFKFPTGYHLTPGTPTYELLHKIRISIGDALHKVHVLVENQQDDVTVFNALYTAYRSWFTDVGIERSAHVLDRFTRLLVADTNHFKISGLRKEYPRPLLIRRANVYHLQRLRHNASPRHKTDQEVMLLHDLIQSSVSYYTEIRRTAQTAAEAAMKVLLSVRSIMISPLLEHLEKSIKANDFQTIKGAIYSLLFGNLAKSVGRDWRYAPALIKFYVDVMDVDKLSVQRLANAATIQVMDMTRPPPRMVILNKEIVDSLQTVESAEIEQAIKKRRETVEKKKAFIRQQRALLTDELADIAKNAHWKKQSRTATLVIGLSLRFDDIAATKTIDLVVERAVDQHPNLRQIYGSALIGLFTYIDMRAISDHKYTNLLLNEKSVPGLARIIPGTDDPEWTSKLLTKFAQADADVYYDHDYPGWLVWGKSIPAFEASTASKLNYDEVETAVRAQIGRQLDRKWFSTFFGFMKQEPRDSNVDRFRMTNIVVLTSLFNLVILGMTPATFDDIKELTREVFGDGTDKHQHRATAEILGGLLNAAVALGHDQKSTIWSYAFPIVRDVFEDGITPENASYWSTFLDFILQNRDPRRSWPLVEWLAGFRLNMASNAAFKESSKINLLEHCILDLGWHFQLQEPILENFLSHLDHPYKGVREVMGQTIACIYRSQYHESHNSVEAFVQHEKAASSIGSRPFKPTSEFEKTIREVFSKIDQWRKERPAGQQTASSYTSGSKTVLAWLEVVLNTFECTQLLPFFPDLILEAILHMMDIKEDPELQGQASSVFRHLGNVPYRAGEEQPFVEALTRVGKTATSWHQRLRILINIQAIYFRHLFLMPQGRQEALFDFVAEILQDSQLEVRVGAAATLSGMIRCSPARLRKPIIDKLTKRFTTLLNKNLVTSRGKTSTPTPEQSKTVLLRHTAVLGLGALVQAFPYSSPPPSWMPEVLATLAKKAAGDPGVVGKSAKGIVSDFKKTRQDTWHIDLKAFTPEQLEDLEGVLWKSYFA